MFRLSRAIDLYLGIAAISDRQIKLNEPGARPTRACIKMSGERTGQICLRHQTINQSSQSPLFNTGCKKTMSSP